MSYTTDLAYYKIKQLEGENEQLRKKRAYFEKLSTERLKATEELHQQLDAAEKEINELKKQNYELGERCQKEAKARDGWKQTCYERGERICRLMREKEDIKQQLDAECKKRCDIEEKLDDIGKRYYEDAQRVGRLEREKEVFRRQLDALTRKDAVFVDLDSVKLKGMEELWGMLGEMFAADHIELGKIFGWCSVNNIAHYTPDVREFLKKFKTWKSGKEEKETEQKRLAYMRDYLNRFCVGKVCYGCPLNTPEFKCYGLSGFKSISDEDLKRYYEKAWESFKEEKSSDEEVPCSFGWKLDGTEFTIETSIPKEDYDNIVKIISGKE